MLRVRDPRVRAALTFALLSIIGVAGYQIALNVWSNRQYHAALEALERYEYDRAGESLENYLFVHPSDPLALILAAQTARRRGDFEGAVRQLRLAEKNGAPSPALVMERKLLRIQGGDLTDTDSLVHFCAEHPDGTEAALCLEGLLEGSLRSLNLPLAKWSVDLWLKHRPGALDQAQGLMWHGRISEFSQDFAQATSDFRRAVELAPDHCQARVLLVEALVRDDPRQAIPDLEWLRLRRPHDPQVLFLSARLRRSLGQPEEASRILDALLAAAPDKVPFLVERARVAMDLKRSQDAERWLKNALALAPEQRDVHLALADCLRQSGRLDEAKSHQDKARQIEERLELQLKQMTQAARGN